MSEQEQIIDIAGDAHRVFDILINGGVAIIPANVGYGIVALDPAALQRVFAAKQRKPHKKHAMIGSYSLHRQLHILSPREEGMVKLLAVDLDLPLGVVAPFRTDHPMMQTLSKDTLAQSSVDGTISMLINGGRFQEELSRLATEAGLPLLGSSANLTGKGTKTTVEDIEPEIRNAADIIIDYGRQRYGHPLPRRQCSTSNTCDCCGLGHVTMSCRTFSVDSTGSSCPMILDAMRCSRDIWTERKMYVVDHWLEYSPCPMSPWPPTFGTVSYSICSL